MLDECAQNMPITGWTKKVSFFFKSLKKSSVVKCTQKSNLNKSENTVLEYYLGKSEPI